MNRWAAHRHQVSKRGADGHPAARTLVGSPREHIGKTQGGFLVLLFVCFLILGCSLYSFLCIADDSNVAMTASFIALGIEGIFFTLLIFVKYAKSGIYMFEPFTIITLVMVLVYFVAPVFQFAAGSTSRYGVEVSQYCPSATGLVMLGYLTFFVAYEFPINDDGAGQRSRGIAYFGLESLDVRRFVMWAWIIWLSAYALNLFYYVGRGFDLTYVVLGGLMGTEDNSQLVDSSVGFLLYMKFILIGSWMMIYAYGENKFAKAVTYILVVMCMFLGGGRMTLLIALLAPIVFYYARLRSSPRFSRVLLVLAGFVALFAFMQVARVGLRAGAGIDLEGMSLDEIFNPFYAEIDDFKSFYALLGTVPEKHDYLYGSQMVLYSVVLLIPRAIFPAKPDPAVHELVYLSLGGQAAANGNAYPSIGEYYVEFGVVGVAVIMAILGVACRHLKNLYLDSKGKSLSVMAYSMIYPMLISIVIRGYFPQNFSVLLFLLAPLLVFLLLATADNKRGRNSRRSISSEMGSKRNYGGQQ